MQVQTAANPLGVSRHTLHRILAGTPPVTGSMALRLGKFCGNGPELWLNLRQADGLWRARQALKAEIDQIKTARAA